MATLKDQDKYLAHLKEQRKKVNARIKEVETKAKLAAYDEVVAENKRLKDENRNLKATITQLESKLAVKDQSSNNLPFG